MTEAQLRADLVRWSRSLFERGLTSGSSGNISVRLPDGGYLVTPTNACLGFLEPDRLARLDAQWRHLSGDLPTKELPLHAALYAARPKTGAVVHLHSTFATLLSCRSDIDPNNAIPPITPYVVMRVGHVPVIPYTTPGSSDIIPLIAAKAPDHAAILIANHGPVVAGASLEAAVFGIEELEETARLVHLARGTDVRKLDAEQIAELNRKFPPR
ncbi:MAG: aldolase [Rhizobiales bacterium]|nr:aldolase [Hyphomicrobiales bacterium]